MVDDERSSGNDEEHAGPVTRGSTRDDPAGVEPDRAVGRRLYRTGPSSGVVPSAHLVLGHRRGSLGAVVLRTGADLATRLNAALHVVHVVDLSDYPIDPDAWDWEQQAGRTLATEEHDVETALAALETSWTYHAAHGNPVALLRKVADEHDALMIVVGTRGEGVGTALSRLIGTPSVSHGLVARTHRPVLVVPPHAASDPGTGY